MNVQQKEMIQSFMNQTGSSEQSAIEYLTKYNWRVGVAVTGYYND